MPFDKDESIRRTLLEKYKELGDWARHYSTVRMTLATYFLTLSLGLMRFRWDSPALGVGFTSFATALLGTLLFSHFTNLTYRRTKNQRQTYNELLKLDGRPEIHIDQKKFNPWLRADGHWAGIVGLVVVFLIDLCWVSSLIKLPCSG